MGLTRRRRRADGGAAAVEFALVALPLFLLLFGILQYGMLLFEVQGAASAVKDAGRWAATEGIVDCGAWEDRAKLRAATNGVAGGLDPDFTARFDYKDSGPDVVTVSLQFSPMQLVPLVPVPTTVTRQAQFDIQTVPDGARATCP